MRNSAKRVPTDYVHYRRRYEGGARVSVLAREAGVSARSMSREIGKLGPMRRSGGRWVETTLARLKALRAASMEKYRPWRAMYDRGVSIVKLAKDAGVSHSTMTKQLERFGPLRVHTILDDPDRRSEIVTAYQQGGKVSDVARRLGVSINTVGRAARDAGVARLSYKTRRKYVLSEEQQAEVARLYRGDGDTVREIGARLGIPIYVVTHFAMSAGLRRRPDPLPQRLRDEIVTAYLDAESGREIVAVAQKYGMSVYTVRRLAKKANTARSRKNRMPKTRRAAIVRLYPDLRKSPEEIAAEVGVSVSTLRKVASRLGVKRSWRKKVIPDQRRALIERLYRDTREPVESIARRLHLSEFTVRRVAREAGIRRAARTPTLRVLTDKFHCDHYHCSLTVSTCLARQDALHKAGPTSTKKFDFCATKCSQGQKVGSQFRAANDPGDRPAPVTFSGGW